MWTRLETHLLLNMMKEAGIRDDYNLQQCIIKFDDQLIKVKVWCMIW